MAPSPFQQPQQQHSHHNHHHQPHNHHHQQMDADYPTSHDRDDSNVKLENMATDLRKLD